MNKSMQAAQRAALPRKNAPGTLQLWRIVMVLTLLTLAETLLQGIPADGIGSPYLLYSATVGAAVCALLSLVLSYLRKAAFITLYYIYMAFVLLQAAYLSVITGDFAYLITTWVVVVFGIYLYRSQLVPCYLNYKRA